MNAAKDGEQEEEEVFVDAETSPEAPQVLRRSTRKGKSISEDIELDSQGTPQVGKCHQPLGKMEGVHRSPDTRKTPQTGPLPKTKQLPIARATLMVQTDPPTNNPTPEQLILLGGCLLYTSPSPRDS